MFLLNNVKFNPDIQHTIGDTQYPPSWFLDAAERAKLGIVEVLDIPRPDPTLYDSTENPDGTWTSILKPPPTDAQLIAEINTTAQSIIYAKWPIWAQQNCNDGTYPPADKELMLADKAAVLTEAKRLTDAIIAGTPAIPAWPASKESDMANNFDSITFAARQIGVGRAAEILA